MSARMAAECASVTPLEERLELRPGRCGAEAAVDGDGLARSGLGNREINRALGYV